MSGWFAETVALFVTPRPQIVADHAAALAWSCGRSSSERRIFAICDSEQATIGAATRLDFALPGTVDPDWHPLAALRDLLDAGHRFNQVVVLRDDTLVIGRALDQWVRERLTADSAGLLGVEDRLIYDDAFDSCTLLFAEWDLPHEMHEQPPSSQTIHPAFYALSYEAAKTLFNRNLLVPDSYALWDLPVGVYLSWSLQLLGFYQVCWGQMDRPRAPLYVNDARATRRLPPPQILRSDFGVFHSIRGVAGYSEDDIRAGYARIRGGTADATV